MNVVLINPNFVGRNRLMPAVPPYALASLAAIAKRHGHAVEIWDAFSTREAPESVVARLIARRPDVVGVSCITPAFPTAERLLRAYRDGGGKGVTVLGGIHPTVFHREMIEQGACDVVVRREGEAVFGELLAALDAGAPLAGVRGLTFRDGSEVVATDDHALIPDIDELPVPAWETVEGGVGRYDKFPWLGLYGPLLQVLASRGCPFRCLHCGQEIFFKFKPFRKRSAFNVVAEIRFLVERFTIRNVGFIDANFPASKSIGMEFCDALLESGLAPGLGWATEVAGKLVDRELLRRMAEAGCRTIEYGFEFGSPEVLERSGKGTTIQQSLDAARWAREAGLRVNGFFLMGYPEERPRHFLKTLRLAMKLDCALVKFNIVVPYPGSDLFAQNREVLLRVFDPETYNPWFQSDDPSRTLTVVPGGLPARTLLFWQRILMFLYYVRPRMIWRYLWGDNLRTPDMVSGAKFLAGGLLRSAWRGRRGRDTFRGDRNKPETP